MQGDSIDLATLAEASLAQEAKAEKKPAGMETPEQRDSSSWLILWNTRRKIAGLERKSGPLRLDAIMINSPEDLKAVARKVIWFDPPEQALGNTQYFLTYLMNYGTDEDLKVVRKYYSDADFEATLDNPAPGVFFRDAWIEWNERYNRVPVPPLPKRQIPGVDPNSIPDLFPAKCYRPRV